MPRAYNSVLAMPTPINAQTPKRSAAFVLRIAPRPMLTCASGAQPALLSYPTERITKGRAQDAIGCQDRPSNCPTDFGYARRARAVAHWQLDDSRTLTRRFHNHLDRPAIGHLAHIQRVQQITPYHAEWPKVGQAKAIQPIHQPRDQLIAKPLVRRHRPSRHTAVHARAKHQVGRSIQYWRQQCRQFAGDEAAITIHKCQQIAARCRDTGRARVAIAAPWLDNDPRTGPPGDAGRVVGRAVVDDEQLVR